MALFVKVASLYPYIRYQVALMVLIMGFLVCMETSGGDSSSANRENLGCGTGSLDDGIQNNLESGVREFSTRTHRGLDRVC